MPTDTYTETHRIYERIHDWWENGWTEELGYFGVCRHAPPGFKLRIIETENWQYGWSLLRQWFNNKVGFEWIRKSAEPGRNDWWANEVHIWSHLAHLSLTKTNGHSLAHAKLEEELTRLILAWLGEKERTEHVAGFCRLLVEHRRRQEDARLDCRIKSFMTNPY